MKRINVKCPYCGGQHSAKVNPAALLGRSTSEAKADAARKNGCKGGRPKGQRGGDKDPQPEGGDDSA